MDVQPHIRCRREDAAEYAILPGDPARVERVKKYLAQVKEIAFNREYKSITGYYKGIKVLVMSFHLPVHRTRTAYRPQHQPETQG